MRIFAVFAMLAATDAWCCRACHNCLCIMYGACPPAAPVETLATPFGQWRVDDVADFLVSLSTGGKRDTCPSRCGLPAVFANATALFRAKGVDGPRLVRLMHLHQHRIEGGAAKNVSLREKHGEWWASHGLVPPLETISLDNKGKPKSQPDFEGYLAFATRLSAAVAERTSGVNESLGATFERLDRAAGASWPRWSRRMLQRRRAERVGEGRYG
jgi:hypothetical protein